MRTRERKSLSGATGPSRAKRPCSLSAREETCRVRYLPRSSRPRLPSLVLQTRQECTSLRRDVPMSKRTWNVQADARGLRRWRKARIRGTCPWRRPPAELASVVSHAGPRAGDIPLTRGTVRRQQDQLRHTLALASRGKGDTAAQKRRRGLGEALPVTAPARGAPRLRIIRHPERRK